VPFQNFLKVNTSQDSYKHRVIFSPNVFVENAEKENVEKRKRKYPYMEFFFFFFRRFPFRRFPPNPFSRYSLVKKNLLVMLYKPCCLLSSPAALYKQLLLKHKMNQLIFDR